MYTLKIPHILRAIYASKTHSLNKHAVSVTTISSSNPLQVLECVHMHVERQEE